MLSGNAFRYLEEENLPRRERELLRFSIGRDFGAEAEWRAFLTNCGITKVRHIRIVTEAALFGGLMAQGFRRDLAILSDDAGQFNVPLLQHGLCWIHAERTIKKLVPVSEAARAAMTVVGDDFWRLYRDLKAFKESPTAAVARDLEQRFDELFKRRTCFASLNQALGRLYRNKSELLLVLQRPELPLHNNTGESDIREYVKRRKVSGGTRSAAGQECRDTFTSLKKTCRKLGISFWDYLKDRLRCGGKIAALSDLIKEAAQAGATVSAQVA